MKIKAKEEIDLNIKDIVDWFIQDGLEDNMYILDNVENGDDLPYTWETIGDVLKGENRKKLYKAIADEFLKRSNA